ncbi:hypothetical protein LR48_Vigan05g121300 [Vigna angularis]|uniref:Uncharacterized protein n=1 Tax=Phaseolus angularis TaxID=3914 RepID=A0A0L9ULI2_PHAAN|nr:hypothetical protein LR48_Vigan05g121300 [Vigna angularis]
MLETVNAQIEFGHTKSLLRIALTVNKASQQRIQSQWNKAHNEGLEFEQNLAKQLEPSMIDSQGLFKSNFVSVKLIQQDFVVVCHKHPSFARQFIAYIDLYKQNTIRFAAL